MRDLVGWRADTRGAWCRLRGVRGQDAAAGERAAGPQPFGLSGTVSMTTGSRLRRAQARRAVRGERSCIDFD